MLQVTHQLGVTPTSIRTKPTAETPGYVRCPNGVLMRQRADGQDPCTTPSTARVTVTRTPSAQQLCKEAGVPASYMPLCESKVKAGMPVAEAAELARKAAETAIVREGRKTVIYPACRQVGVPEEALQQCYDALKKGVTPEQQAAILQQIANEMAAQGVQPAAATYPAGTVHYYDAQAQVYRIAVPVTAAATTSGLGQAQYVEVTSTTDPTAQGSTPSTKEDVDAKTGKAAAPTTTALAPQPPVEEKPLWKKWWLWAAVGGTVIVGTGAYFVFRRRGA